MKKRPSERLRDKLAEANNARPADGESEVQAADSYEDDWGEVEAAAAEGVKGVSLPHSLRSFEEGTAGADGKPMAATTAMAAAAAGHPPTSSHQPTHLSRDTNVSSTPDDRIRAKLAEEASTRSGTNTRSTGASGGATAPGVTYVQPTNVSSRTSSTADDRLRAKMAGESSVSSAHASSSTGASGGATAPGVTYVQPTNVSSRTSSTPDERLRAKMESETAAKAPSIERIGAMPFNSTATGSTPDERIKSKMAADAATRAGVAVASLDNMQYEGDGAVFAPDSLRESPNSISSNDGPGNAVTTPSGVSAVSSPDARLRAKLASDVATRSEPHLGGPDAAAAVTASTAASSDQASAGIIEDMSVATDSTRIHDDRVQAKLRAEASLRAIGPYAATATATTTAAAAVGGTQQPGVTAYGATGTAVDTITPDDRIQAKARGESSSSLGAHNASSSDIDPAALKRDVTTSSTGTHSTGSTGTAHAVTPDERLQQKLQSDSAQRMAGTTAATTTFSSGRFDGDGDDLKLPAVQEDREMGEYVPDSLDSSRGISIGPGAFDSDSRQTSKGSSAGVGAAAVAGPGAHEYEGGDRTSRFVEEEYDSSAAAAADNGASTIHEGGANGVDASESGEPPKEADAPLEKKRDGSICGMARRKFYIVSALASLVVVAVAIGAAAGTGAFSSSSSSPSPGTAEDSTAPQQAPLATPSPTPELTVIVPAVPSPIESTPPECQLSSLPKEDNLLDKFGADVAVSGDTAIVAAPSSTSASGSVHIYERGDDGGWIKSSTVLVPSDSFSGNRFGRSIDIDGDTIVIGSTFDVSGAFDDLEGLFGCAYVFARRTDGNWVEEARLVAADVETTDSSFASSVSIYNDTVVIGEPIGENHPNGERSGSVYVFHRNGTAWSQTKLQPSDGADTDYFGSSVDVHDSVAVIGTRRDDTDNGKDSGSAYVFSRTADGAWIEEDKLLPSDGSRSDNFGSSVAITWADYLVVGANGDDDKGFSSGSVYVFINSNGQWSQAAKLVPEDGESSDSFGRAVDVDGDLLAIGAPGVNFEYGVAENTGAVYIYERVGFSVWTLKSKLEPPKNTISDESRFGGSCSIDGNTVIGGAYSDTLPFDTGAAHTTEVC